MDLSDKQLEDERRKFVSAFTNTMVKIWQERIAILGVIDTGTLYRSVMSGYAIKDSAISEVDFTFRFSEYGVYVNDGTGREIKRGNTGDIGRAKVRKPRKWLRPKYYMSVMNLREFFAESFSLKFINIMDSTLSKL